MHLTLEFLAGTPDTPSGAMQYCFVQHRSPHDHKVRVFGAYYLNEYKLYFEDGPCPQCPYPNGEEDCIAVAGDGCPTTGWFEEKWHPEYDSVYEPLRGDVIGFARQPEPTI